MPTFTPPTHEEPMRTRMGPLEHFRLTWALSVVKVGGTYISGRAASFADLLPTLIEGVDYFLGGRTYDISEEIAAALTAAGFLVQQGASSGYGSGPYGFGSYGG